MVTMKFYVLILTGIMLSGCATMNSTQQQQATIVLNKCPVLNNYSQSQMTKAAQELKSIPSDSQISRLIRDYSKLRDACRVAERKLSSTK